MAEIAAQTQELLWRPMEGQVHFTDVAPERAGLNEEAWWRRTDFDAPLTIEMESMGLNGVTEIPIGLRPWLTQYGLVLLDDLVKARIERLATFDPTDKNLHPDILAELARAAQAPVAGGNYAPRDEEHAANNGSNFYLAVTDSGLEIYVTPLTSLQSLEARHRITALYEIPNEGHPELNGDKEQFRSARIVRTRRHPEHLVPIFEYKDRAALIAAKQAGAHPQIIPLDQRKGHIAFIDKFANGKVEFNDEESLTLANEVGKVATLEVINLGEKHTLEVAVARDLRSAPLGRLAVWRNCSDHEDSDVGVGFVELGVRVNDNPSTSTDTGFFHLLRHIPNLDPAAAELRLVGQ